MALNEVTLTRNQLNALKEKIVNYGGESILVKSNSDDIIYKLYRDEISQEERIIKHQKLERLVDRKVENITNPTCVLIVDGQIVGHGFSYDYDDMSMLIYPLTTKTKIKYLRRIKEILKVFERKSIFYPDLKSDNILINLKTGEIKFCDIDSIQIDDIPSTNLEEYTKRFLNGKLLDKRIHSYLHNLMTLDLLFTDTSDCFIETIRQIDLDILKEYLNEESLEIIRSIVNCQSNYQDLYLIDGINPQNIVKYKKR